MNKRSFIPGLTALTLMHLVCVSAQESAAKRALTKPNRSRGGEVVEYTVMFRLQDKLERPVWTHYQINLGTGQVVCGHTNREGFTQRVSSGTVQTSAIVSLPLKPCVAKPASDKTGNEDREKSDSTNHTIVPMGAGANDPR